MSNLKRKEDFNSLELIKQSGILTKEDVNSLEIMAEELRDTFLKVQMFRTPTEMRVSVLNDIKHPTPDSKYWQSVREQNVMYTETINLSYEYRKKQIELKKLQRSLEAETDDLEQELKQIEIEQAEWSLLNMEKTAKARINELNEWSSIKKELENDLNFSKEDVNEHQLMSYASRFINQYQVKGNSGSPSENQNLIGQLQSSIKEIEKRGLTEAFLEQYGDSAPEVAQFIGNYIEVPQKYIEK